MPSQIQPTCLAAFVFCLLEASYRIGSCEKPRSYGKTLADEMPGGENKGHGGTIPVSEEDIWEVDVPAQLPPLTPCECRTFT